MHYMVMIRRGDEPVYVHDSILPGIIPDHVVELLKDSAAQEMGICKGCEQAFHCHVLRHRPDLGEHTFDKLCPILFHDVFRPRSWTIKQLV